MAEHTALRESVWGALQALPRPVTRESVEACAKEAITGREQGEFLKWFEANEGYLLGRLNG